MEVIGQHDNAVQAILLSPRAAERLCAAAGIDAPPWKRQETPEPVLRNMIRQLTGRDLDDLITEDDVLSRRPYQCRVCGRPFTIVEFNRTRHDARVNGLLDPFAANAPVHRGCTNA